KSNAASICETWRQKSCSVSRAACGPPLTMPEANATAFIAPALVALTASMASLPSSSTRSITPQTNAPWAPPPCSAKLTFFIGSPPTTRPQATRHKLPGKGGCPNGRAYFRVFGRGLSSPFARKIFLRDDETTCHSGAWLLALASLAPEWPKVRQNWRDGQ